MRPCNELTVCMRSAMSGRLVRPIGIAPAASIRSTTGASVGTTACANAGTPQVVGRPDMSIFSFTVKGTPCRGPDISPAASLLSAKAALARASSARTRTTAFSVGFTVLMRAKWASTTSIELSCRRAMRCANSVAESCQISLMSGSEMKLCKALPRATGRQSVKAVTIALSLPDVSLGSYASF